MLTGKKKKFGKLERSGNLKVFQPNSNSCARVHMNKAPGSNFQEASQRCCRSHIALLADVFLSSIPALRYLSFKKKSTKKKGIVHLSSGFFRAKFLPNHKFDS